MRLTTKDIFRSSATSHPWGNTGYAARGNSGCVKTDIASDLKPDATKSLNACELVSIAS